VSPRVRVDIVHPRLQSGACARPLNFTVRRRVNLARIGAVVVLWGTKLLLVTRNVIGYIWTHDPVVPPHGIG